MRQAVAAALIDLNRRFYSEFAAAFALTRRGLQPGVRRVLASLPDEGRWLDLGCGSGALAREWAARGRQSAYLGLDFSLEFIEEARGQAISPGAAVEFRQADLSAADWDAGLPEGGFRGVLAFATLHHLPDHELRRAVLRRVHRLLAPGGLFVHSEWQFTRSEKLLGRVQPWERIGLSAEEVETGDALLDWRFALPAQTAQVGLRYVHAFEREELRELAHECGFTLLEEFESDGRGGNLALYQLWLRG